MKKVTVFITLQKLFFTENVPPSKTFGTVAIMIVPCLQVMGLVGLVLCFQVRHYCYGSVPSRSNAVAACLLFWASSLVVLSGHYSLGFVLVKFSLVGGKQKTPWQKCS